MGQYRRLFKNKNFFFLWVGQLISALGDRFTQMSLLTIVMVITQDTGEKMAWITFYSLLPFLLFGQVFGVISDRLNRKKIMIVADIIRAALVFSIPFIHHYTYSFAALCIVVFCVGTLSAFFSPAKIAVIPMLVTKEYLMSANSLIISTGMFSTLMGTLIAGYLIKLIGPYPSFYFDGITFFLSAVMIAHVILPKISQIKEQITITALFKGIKEGLHFINRHQLILRIVQLNAVFSLLSSFFYITLLNYSTTYLHLAPDGYGILLACLGIGLSTGALLLGRKVGKIYYNRIILSGFSLIALANFLFLAQPHFIFSLIILFIAGIGASLVMVTLDSLLQRTTPNSLRANVFGARGIITNAFFLGSLIMVGKLLNFTGALSLFAGLGLISLLTAAAIFLSEGSLGYRLLRGVLRLILRLFFQLKVEGNEYLFSKRRVILAGNHTSALDGLVVMAAYPKRVYFLVAESLFKLKFLGFFARQLGFIPIKRGGFNKEAMRESLRILENGDTIGIFPEGEITDDGKLTKGKKGVAVIAIKTGVPIIPFAIEGAYFAWPRFNKYPQRHPVQIRFGKPLDINAYEFPQEMVDEVMEEIKTIKTEMEKEQLLEVEPNVIIRHLIDFG